jgi:hypothetical protein
MAKMGSHELTDWQAFYELEQEDMKNAVAEATAKAKEQQTGQ